MFKNNALKPIMLLTVLYFWMSAAKNIDPPNLSQDQPLAVTPNIQQKPDLRKEIVKFSEKYLETKYKYGGTTPKGFDCSGFTFFVMNHFGIKLPHNSAAQSKKGKKVSLKRAKAGDLLFFSNKKGINHVGLVISNSKKELKMIHSSSKRGIVIDEIYGNTYWEPRLKFARNVID